MFVLSKFRIAHTCTDLAGGEIIRRQDISAALNFRSLDRKYWRHGKITIILSLYHLYTGL